MSSLWRIIYEQVERLPVIDTHEHLPHHDIRCSEAGDPMSFLTTCSIT